MMKKKVILSVLFVGVFFGVVSWLYKLSCLWMIVFLWKDDIKQKFHFKHLMIIVNVVFAVCLFMVMPRFRYQTDDRVQLLYQDRAGHAILPPLSHYLMNVLLPEEDIMNLGILGARIGVGWISSNVGGTMCRQFQEDVRRGKLCNFYCPVDKLNRDGLFMMSGVTSQCCNMIGLPQTQSVYLVKPKNYDPKKKYPVVFFCHGLLGNWKLYQGIWKDLDDCIVLSVGTRDWSGIFGYNDINAIFTRQIPFLKSLGYRIDESQLHIMGLSNGGTAANVVYKHFANRFKSITFISTGIHHTFPVNSKILMVGGGEDGSSASLQGGYRQLKNSGVKASLFWDKDETHFILVNQREEILKFLNQELLGHKAD